MVMVSVLSFEKEIILTFFEKNEDYINNYLLKFNKTTCGQPISFIIKNNQAFIESTRLQKKAIKKYINQSFLITMKNYKITNIEKNSGTW